jgi:hypothetical protein
LIGGKRLRVLRQAKLGQPMGNGVQHGVGIFKATKVAA